MHRLDPEGSREVIQQALNEGSKEMRVAAIECLGTSDDDLAYLLEQARSKVKDVGAAALGALLRARSKSADVVAALKKAIAGADLRLIVGRVKECSLPEIRNYALEQAEQQLAEVLKLKDKKLQGPAMDRLQQLVSSLDERSDPKAEAFLLTCFEHAAALGRDQVGTIRGRSERAGRSPALPRALRKCNDAWSRRTRRCPAECCSLHCAPARR
jgi:hypothetical protein